MADAISVKALEFYYGENRILKGIDFNLIKGEILGILGPNGGGKTTLLKIISGILRGYKGSVEVMGKEVESYRRKELAAVVSYVPQAFDPSFELKTKTVVSFGRNPHIGIMKGLSTRDLEKIDRSMEMTDVLEFGNRLFSTLSGGEKQRVIIAKALAQEGQLMLLDEFSAHLDPGHSQKVINMATDLIRREHLTAISVFHDLNQAIGMVDRILFLKNGRVIARGKPEEVITEKLVEEVYGARNVIIENPVNGRPLVLFR